MNQIRDAFASFLLSTGLDVPTLVITIITTAVSVSLLTRLLSGSSAGKLPGPGQSPSPPLLPYWIPYLGHFIPFVYDQESVLKDARYISFFNCRISVAKINQTIITSWSICSEAGKHKAQLHLFTNPD
jgi:hypothetical protein